MMNGSGKYRPTQPCLLPGLICLTSLVILLGLALLATPVRANRALPTDLSYRPETTWLLPGLPSLDETSGYIPHNFSHGEAIFKIGQEIIHGFRPGKVYPEMYARDIAWGMETAQYYYPDEYLREPVEAYLRRQYTAHTRSLDGDFGVVAGAGAIGGILTPDGRSNKQTITTDEETSLIHAAYLYYHMLDDPAWLRQPVNGLPVIDRLNLAAEWLYSHRLDGESQLLWRGHTTDWGDVKFEKGPGYTDFNPAQDHKTASIYDQALAYLALIELARLNAAVGDADRAYHWQTRAEALKQQTNRLLWQPEKGFYLTHRHITSLAHDFDESEMVSISNALAVYAGLTDREQAESIFHHLDRVQAEAGANKPGLSLYPYYPNQWPDLFFDYSGMGYGNYQNGGVWDWWGGVQIKAEFLNGFSERGRRHLLQVAADWQEHPGNIIEWHSTTDPRHEGSSYYSAAAGTMGSAIIEGFFGVELTGQGLTIQPRMGLNDGFIRVYQPATDRYAAYSYDWDDDIITLRYGTNAAGPVKIRILKLRSERIWQATIDGQPAGFETTVINNDTYTGLTAPSGQHEIQLIKRRPAAPTPSPTATATPQPALAAPSDRAGDLPAPPTPSPVEIIAARNARRSTLAFFQFAGGGLVILTSLALIVLVAIRRVAGLS